MTSDTSPPPRVGFAGLGRMGRRMAGRLQAAGLPLTVYNRTAAACAPLAEAGAAVASSPAELARASDVVVTMLAGPQAALDVIADPNGGVLAGARPGTVLVEMSTIGPRLACQLADQAREAGIDLLDAPVSGSTPAAESGMLVAFVGGEAAALKRARPVLEHLCAKLVHMGRQGSGATIKLAVNGVLAVLNGALAEALVFAERSGLERERAYDAFASSAIAAPYVAYKRSAFLQPGEGAAFTVDGLRKDLALALEAAAAADTPLFAASDAAQVLAAAAGAGWGDADIAAVARWLRNGGAAPTG